MEAVFKDDEFQSLNEAKRRSITNNYFDDKFADDDFRALPEEKQNSIKRNFFNDQIQATPKENADIKTIATEAVPALKTKAVDKFVAKAEEEDKSFFDTALDTVNGAINTVNDVVFKADEVVANAMGKGAEGAEQGFEDGGIFAVPKATQGFVIGVTTSLMDDLFSDKEETPEPVVAKNYKEKAGEIRARLDNVNMSYSDIKTQLSAFAKKTAGVELTPEDEERLAKIKEQQELANIDTIKLLDSAHIPARLAEDGKIYIKDDDGKEEALDSSFFDTMIEDIKVGKYELAGDVAGGAIGYKATKIMLERMGTLPNARAKAGAIVGGILLAGYGAFVGRGADVEDNKAKLIKQLEQARDGQKLIDKIGNIDTLDKQIDAGIASVTMNIAGDGLIRTAGYLAKQVKMPFKKVLDKIKDGSVDEIYKHLETKGYSKDQIAKIKTEFDEYIKSGHEKGIFTSNTANTKADEVLSAFLTKKDLAPDMVDILKKDADASTVVAQSIDDRTKQTLKSFEEGAMDTQEAKTALDDIMNTAKTSYKSMKDTLFNLVGKDTPLMSPQNLSVVKDESILTTLDRMGREVKGFDKAENALSRIQAKIEDKTALTVEELLDIRQELSLASRGGGITPKNKKLLEQMSHQVDNSIFEAVGTTTKNEDLMKQFKGEFIKTNKEYARAKGIKDTQLYSKLNSNGSTLTGANKELANAPLLLGDDFIKTTRQMPKEQRKAFQSKAVSELLKSMTYEATTGQTAFKSGTADTLRTALKNVTDKEVKQNLEATIKMLDLFESDEVLLKATSGKSAIEMNEGIATTLLGKMKYQAVSKMYKYVAPVISIGSGKKGYVLTRHITEQLDNTQTVKEFIDVLSRDKVINTKQANELSKKAEQVKNFRELSERSAQRKKEILAKQEAKEISAQEAKQQIKAQEKAEITKFYTKNPSAIDRELVKAVSVLSGEHNRFGQTQLETFSRALGEGKTLHPDDIKYFVDKMDEVDKKELFEYMSKNAKEQKQIRARNEAIRREMIDSGEAQRNMNDALSQNSKAETITDGYQAIIDDGVKLNDNKELVDSSGRVLFAKGMDNLAVATIGATEFNEDGVPIDFDPEKFAVGLLGYTAFKKLGTDKAVQSYFKKQVQSTAKALGKGGVLVVDAIKKKYPMLDLSMKIVDDTGAGATKELLAQHNLTAKNLKHASDKGGLAVPSIAVTKADTPISGFGDITLFGGKDLATPSSKNKVFGSDIYSPRYPTVEKKLSIQAERIIGDELGAYSEKIGKGYTNVDFSDLGRSEEMKAIFVESLGKKINAVKNKATREQVSLYAKFKDVVKGDRTSRDIIKDDKVRDRIKEYYINKGFHKDETMLTDEAQFNRLASSLITSVKDAKRSIEKRGTINIYDTSSNINKIVRKNQEKFNSFVSEYYKKHGAEEVIYNGTDSMGRQKYVTHTLDNVVKKLKKNLRGGEDFYYGVGSTRAKLAPEYKSLKQVVADKEKLVDRETFEKIADEYDDVLIDMTEKLKPFYSDTGFGFMDKVLNVIGDSVDTSIKRELKDYGFKEVPDELVKELENFKTALGEMPTEYFEVKYLGVKELSSFKHAMIPKESSRETKAILKENGIKYSVYDKDIKDDKMLKMKEMAKKNGWLFAVPFIYLGQGDDK